MAKKLEALQGKLLHGSGAMQETATRKELEVQRYAAAADPQQHTAHAHALALAHNLNNLWCSSHFLSPSLEKPSPEDFTHTLSLSVQLCALLCVRVPNLSTTPTASKQEALQEQSAAEAHAGRRVAELEEVTLAEGKKYGSVAEEVEAKRRKLERLEKRLAELQADIRDAYRDFQQVDD